MQESILNLRKQDSADGIEITLRSIAQNILVAVFGLLPILFIPVTYVPLEYAKTILVIVGVLIALIFFGLSVLRSGTIKLSSPLALLALWLLVGVSAISALLSGDLRDAFVGDTFGVHTTVFMFLMASVATLIVMFGQTKASIMRIYLLLSGSAVLLTVYHVLRLLFGPDTLSLGLFTGSVSSPIGGWNQLGLFFGLVILLALVALEQLPLTKWGRVMFSGVITLSLLMLAVVNFVAIWVVLGLVSLVMLMYSLTKDRFAEQAHSSTKPDTSIVSVLVSTGVFVTSLVFIIGGSTVGTFVSDLTNVSYIEVRPSFEATLDIARSVYSENAFVGVGPNKFVDAWRMYKDPSINQTVFWNTDFQAGSSYVLTFFISTGIFGVLAFLAFIFFWFKAGIKMLFSSQTGDRFWYFIASSSFVAATYLWGMSFIYVTGTTMLLLAAVFSGIAFAAYVNIVPTRSWSLSVFNNKRSGIILVGVVMLLIVTTSVAMYYTTRHYSSVATFNEALQSVVPGAPIESVERGIADAYAVHHNDLYARELAQYQIAKMNSLMGVVDPTPAQQQQFQQSAANGINAINLALQSDNTDPRNHRALGTIYGVLLAAGVKDVSDLALNSLETARKYDPTSPVYSFIESQIYVQLGDNEKARAAILQAIELKPNYADALFLLTQIDIASGNVASAIAATEAIVNLDPRNPARHYQLGVLYSSDNRVQQAANAFERAVQLDPNYANARYFLALAYVQLERTDDAIAQLEIVRDLNPDNAVVDNVISQIKSGEISKVETNTSEPVVDTSDQSEPSQGADVSSEDLESSLVSPVNVVPDAEAEEAEEAAE